MKKFKKSLAILLVAVFMTRLGAPVLIYAAPELPEQPELPGQNDPTPAPTVRPTSTPKPAETPSPANATPTPTPLSTPTATPVSYGDDVQTLSASSTPAPTPNEQVSDQIGGNVDITTGDVTGTGNITNTGNNNSVATPAGSSPGGTGAGSVVVDNTKNGSNSNNSATVSGDSSSTIVQDNEGDLDNNLTIDSNTGHNEASRNLANASITSGDAFSSGIIANMINTNSVGAKIAEFNILEDQRGDYILDFDANCVIGCGTGGIAINNQNNGAGSTNQGTVDITDSSQTFQNNDADVENNMMLTANTGNNLVQDNLGEEHSITTGDATVSASILNFLNNNFYGDIMLGVVNIFGDFVGDILIPKEYASMLAANGGVNMTNSGNGSDTTNTGTYNETTNDTYNQNNLANIINNINVGANTGGNDISDNLGQSHGIQTGDTNVDVNLLNIANNNFIGNNWWFVIVNEAGNWVGKLIALPGTTVGGNMAMSQNTNMSTDGEGNVDISNNGNLAGSTNTGTVNQTSNNSVDQNNTANIVNNVDLFANTGNNEISKNLGNGSIITGDANAMVNIVNFVNNNFIGSNIFVTVVNVFGSWVGDFITPGAQKEVLAGVGGVDNLNNNNNNNQTPIINSNKETFVAPIPTSSPLAINNFSATKPVVFASNNTATEDDDNTQTAVLAYSNPLSSDNTTDSSNGKIRINLAWLLPIGLVAFGGFVIKKKILS